MAIVVIGVNHRTSPLELLERVSIGAGELGKFLAHITRREHVSEAVVVSTCNRTEIYAVVERFHDSYAGLRTALAEQAAVDVVEIADQLIVENDEAAAIHLFSVAAGLESAVVGETEILGQIKGAWEFARREGAAGPQLNNLFRHAVHVGKRVRTETAISRSIASASAAAVALARERLGSFEERTMMVIGAGEMGEQMTVALADAGAASVFVSNRSAQRAEALADRVGGSVVPFGDVGDALGDLDVLLTSTSSPSTVISPEMVARAMVGRAERPLLIVDIAVPRDVDPAVADVEGVHLCDMDDLRRFVDAGIAMRRGEITAVQAIIEEELVRHGAQNNARSVAPVIADLHHRAEAIRAAELERFAPRLADLDERQREALEALTHGIVAKLLHRPSVRLGELAGTPRGDRIIEAIGDLYGLDELDGHDTDRPETLA